MSDHTNGYNLNSQNTYSKDGDLAHTELEHSADFSPIVQPIPQPTEAGSEHGERKTFL